MNYGFYGTHTRYRHLKSLYPKFIHMISSFIISALIFSVPSIIVICSMLVYGAYRGIIKTTPRVTFEDLKPLGYSSALYDLSGNKITTLVASDANRVYTTIDNIPLDVQHAFIAIEDRNFYEHNGVDAKGMVRALKVGLTSGSFSQGASTITQQLVKNSVFTNWTSETKLERWKRKLQEQQIAINIENKERLSKDTILELYLNTINLGQNTLGIQAASQRYFDKNAKELTLSEGAVLAAIPQNPTKYNPITHPENNADRRLKVLSDMLEQGFISENQYNNAIDDKVYERIRNINNAKVTENVNSYFVDAVIDQVLKDLQDKLHYTEQQAYYTLYAGGLTIYTTLDPEIQNICDEFVSNEENFPKNTKYDFEISGSVRDVSGNYISLSTRKMRSILDLGTNLYNSTEDIDAHVEEYRKHLIETGYTDIELKAHYIPQPQISATIIDQRNGHVRGIIGGRGVKTTARSFNRATSSERQPGSTFKVLAAYLPAFDTGEKTLNSTQVDESYNYVNGRPVRNYYSGYKGVQTLRKAIEQSLNIVTVKTLTDITPQIGFEYLKRLGFTTLIESQEKDGKIYSDVTQALALGGVTYGVYNTELCAAYASIANGGVYYRPTFYTSVRDHTGTIILSNEEEKEVFKESTAYMLTSAMKDVILAGTGKAVAFQGQDMAGKTGTTSDNKDVWFVGYTPYYTCATWAGYDNNQVLNTAEERALAKTAWKYVMEKIHKKLPYKQFKIPKSVKFMKVCTTSHKIATDKCPSVYMEVFDSKNVPTDHCTSSHYTPPPAVHSGPNTQAPAVPQLTPEQIQQILAIQAAQAAQQNQQ